MSELIDRQAVRLLESDADAYTENWNNDYEKGFCDAINKVLELPTIESAPVKHGRWILYGRIDHYKEFICSACLEIVTSNKLKFCPNCGAKMDGGAVNA